MFQGNHEYEVEKDVEEESNDGHFDRGFHILFGVEDRYHHLHHGKGAQS